jgi:hypothetical protein
VLLVWRYDRFARSMQELVNALAEFESLVSIRPGPPCAGAVSWENCRSA